MTKFAKNVFACLYCQSDHIQKNGILPAGGQRFHCTSCNKHFSVGGARGTYDKSFKALVVDQYVHQHIGARELAQKFHISTSTLVQWAKSHKTSCKKCKKTP